MIRFLVPLSDEVKEELWELAQREHRDTRKQAALLIVEALKRRKQEQFRESPETIHEIRLLISVNDESITVLPKLEKNEVQL